METNQYLNDVVLPYFSGFIHQNVDMGLFTPDGIIIGCTAKGAENVGLKVDEVIGLSYETLDINIIKKICKLTVHNVSDIVALFQKLWKLNKIVIQEKRIISYIDVIPYKMHYSATLVTHTPIFNPTNGEVVATQTIGTTYHLYGIVDYINKLNNEENQELSTLTVPENNFNLTPRQHEVLFLLLIGLSQSEIATVLGIVRGTISTIITHQLCHKFEITNGSTKSLLIKARKYDLHKYVPQSLYKPQVIVLDNDIRQKYFSGY